MAETSWDWVGLSARARGRLGALPRDQDLGPALVERRLDQRRHLGPRQRAWLREGLALAAYQAQTDWPVVRALLCDDAPQFHGLTAERARCWAHEGRHYKQLTPYLPQHRERLDEFLDAFWEYYDELLADPSQAQDAQPTPEERAHLPSAGSAQPVRT